MAVSGACPNCGAPIEFTAARSVVTVCDNCETVVGRVGEAFENFGKVAELVRTDSPLQIGAVGKFQGRAFEILGRVQLKHATGAVWDEWYAAFDGGKSWGWIAEAQGKVHLTFPKRIKRAEAAQTLTNLRAGTSVTLPGVGVFRVAEAGRATIGFADGEIPYAVRPGTTHEYADLEGANDRFASLDFRESPPTMYVGRRVTYDQLGLALSESREDAIPEARTLSVNCPTCGGTLELRAPDASERVVCPYCDSLHDIAQGNLKYLSKLYQPGTEPRIPLGTAGTLRGRNYMVIGHLRREVTYEGLKYPWDEYLLATAREPFHWLINANDHWSLGKSVSAGEVDAQWRTAYYGGKSFRLFDRSRPRIVAVHGEMPWKVQFGEVVESADYIAPPLMLSRELSQVSAVDETASGTAAGSGPASESADAAPGSWGSAALAAREANWIANENSDEPIPLEPVDGAIDEGGDDEATDDEATAVTGGAAPARPTAATQPPKLAKSSRKALRKQGKFAPLVEEVNFTVAEYLPRAEVAAAFPLVALPMPMSVAPNQPYSGKRLYLQLAIAFAVVLVSYLLLSTVIRPGKVFEVTVPQQAVNGQEFWSEPFELKGWRNVRIRAVSSTSWGYVDGALRNDGTNTLREFALLTEGQSARHKYLSAVPAGTYRLRVKSKFGTPPGSGSSVTVSIAQGAVNPTGWMILLGGIGVAGVLVLLIHFGFERSRWSASDYSPFGSSSDE